jgi:hypothetical protein
LSNSSGDFKNIIIADFDELDTTNLNRIWAGFTRWDYQAIIAAKNL